MSCNPENIRPMRDLVAVRRIQNQSHYASDPTRKDPDAKVRIAHEDALGEGSSIVLATTVSDVTRAVVISAGPDTSLKAGDIVGVPGREQDTPIVREIDENGNSWEMWHEHQLHYVADFVEVET